MSTYKEYSHLIPSLEVFPRVFYFSKRYNDFGAKFSKFVGKHEKLLEFETPKNPFAKGLVVKVIGKDDLKPEYFIPVQRFLYDVQVQHSTTSSDKNVDYIFPVNPHKEKVKDFRAEDNSPDKRKLTDSSDLTVVICHATIDRLNDEGFREIEIFLSNVARKRKVGHHDFFLLCRTENPFTPEEEDAFRGRVEILLRNSPISSQVIITTRSDDIRDEIYLHLEGKIVKHFLDIQAFLQQYTNGHLKSNTTMSLVKEDNVTTPVKYFLETSGLRGLESIAGKDLTSILGKKNIKKLEATILRKLSEIVRCSIVQPLSKRHAVSLGLGNRFLIANDFEKKMIKKVSLKSKYQLSNFFVERRRNMLQQHSVKKTTESFQSNYCSYTLCSLQTDLADLVTEMERNFGRLTRSVKKMLFEIDSCLKKTKVDLSLSKQLLQQRNVKIDADLRKKILSFETVYAVGTVYGQLEVYVQGDKKIGLLQSEVHKLLRERNIVCPFQVRAVSKMPEMFADSGFLEHGERIECSTRIGTLAGFVDGSDRKLYGLTCAHVVKCPDGEESDVFISDGSNNAPVLFAKSIPNLIVSTGDATMPLIDLAAVRVEDSLRNKCMKYLKDDDAMLKPGILAADRPEGLVGEYVFKHGAITQCTKGLVCSDDLILNAEELHYIILIDNYDDEDGNHDNGNSFAEPGDSGSMICTPDENEVYTVKAIGILSGGKFTPAGEETPKNFSFRLHDGLKKLKAKGGVYFTLPLHPLTDAFE